MHQIINFIGLLFVASTISLCAQTKVSKKAEERVASLAHTFIEQAHLPGVSIAVSKNDQIIYAKGFGLSNIEKGIEMSTNSRTRAASVSKVITATALGKLATEGKLDFDAPIFQYVPYINKQYAQLTTRQLAGHTAGMAHRPKGNRHKKKQYKHMRETVELMDAPLLFEPDTDYQYSTHAYNLLGAVIEGASGVSYEQYMNTLFKDLNMIDTQAENIKELDEKDTEIYYIRNKKLKKERLTNASYKIPGAGFRSTPTDLVRMMSAYTKGYISKEVVRDMFSSHQLKDGKPTQVGIGWRFSIDAFGHRVIEHAGSWLGARTVVVHYPDENMNISLMVNATSNLLIEETAHLFAEVIRNDSLNDRPKMEIDQNIIVTFNSQEGPKIYQGKIMLKGYKGIIKTTSDGFLKETTLVYMGRDNTYALATSFGLMYTEIDASTTLEAKIFAYQNRLKASPLKEVPLVLIR